VKANFYIAVFVFLSFFSCRKDKIPNPIALPIPTNPTPIPTDTSKIFSPTPYILVHPYYFGNRPIPADNPLTVEGIELGRMLFYEKRLSANNTMSCATCHQQSKAFTDGNAFSTGIDGIQGKRSAMAIQNLHWVTNFFWDGRVNSLEAQALLPIEDPIEMHLPLDSAVNRLQKLKIYRDKFFYAFGSETITKDRIAKAIAQFERTLISSNSKYDKYLRGEYSLTESEQRGMELFFTHPIPDQLRGGNCGDCHGSYLVSLNGFHNNGLIANPIDSGRGKVTGNSFDNFKMRAPSLRNIELTAPYMHNGMFNTLEEVLNHYNEHIQYNSPNLDVLITDATNELGETTLMLTTQEKADIISFLKTLTDEDFISNPKFSNPF
jgi:cytochrome c peroxidase